MIINNVNITGIYIYDYAAVYEKGDFIVAGDKLYVCNGRVTGKDPRDSSNRDIFKLYLSDEVASTNEVIEYIENGKSSELGQKLISAKTLGELLSRYMSGFNDKGIITNKITSDRSIIISDFFNNTTTVPSQSLNPLDIILEMPTLNNVVFLVDKEVVNSLSLVESNTTASIGVTGEIVLRQYTYTKSGETTRIQELVDHRTASILYRSVKKDPNTNTFSSLNTTWNTSLSHLRENIQSLNLVRNYYLDQCNKLLIKEVNSLEDFRYRSTKLRYGYDSSDTLRVPISMMHFNELSIELDKDWSGTLVFSLENNSYDIEEIPFIIPFSVISGLVNLEFTIGTLSCGATVVAKPNRGKYIEIIVYNTGSQQKKVTGLVEIITRRKKSLEVRSIFRGNVTGDPVTDNPLRSTTNAVSNNSECIAEVSSKTNEKFTNGQFLITINPTCQIIRDNILVTSTKRYSVSFMVDDIIKNRHMSYMVSDVNLFDEWSKSEIESELGISDASSVNLSQVYKIAIEDVVVVGDALDSFKVKVTHHNSLDKKALPFYINRFNNIYIKTDWVVLNINIL